jgi:hypothetical protein
MKHLLNFDGWINETAGAMGAIGASLGHSGGSAPADWHDVELNDPDTFYINLVPSDSTHARSTRNMKLVGLKVDKHSKSSGYSES